MSLYVCPFVSVEKEGDSSGGPGKSDPVLGVGRRFRGHEEGHFMSRVTTCNLIKVQKKR